MLNKRQCPLQFVISLWFLFLWETQQCTNRSGRAGRWPLGRQMTSLTTSPVLCWSTLLHLTRVTWLREATAGNRCVNIHIIACRSSFNIWTWRKFTDRYLKIDKCTHGLHYVNKVEKCVHRLSIFHTNIETNLPHIHLYALPIVKVTPKVK